MKANHSASLDSIAAGQRLRQRGALRLLSFLVIGLMLVGFLPRAALADSVTVDNTSSGTIYDDGCGTYFVERYFLVSSHISVTDVKLGLNVSHTTRGELMAKLTSPKGTVVGLFASSSDSNSNYDILLDGTSGGSLNDGSDDSTSSPYYDRTVLLATLTTAFDNQDAFGGWKVMVCDNASSSGGTFNRAQLQLTGTAIPAFIAQHKQGPAIVETFFMPWPEDQFWTAVASIFTPGRSQANGDDEACTSSGANYDADPMLPMINYASITINATNTVVTYDQWEDGYEATAVFPSQNTTGVWGDGDLLNGAAPYDADDILVPGQVVILNWVVDPTTLQTVIDFDARDKISASKGIAVSRVLWPNGASTLLAHADEVYPTSMWGTDYRLPVGENADVNEMFQYTGVSVLAALNGTTLYIDKNSDGTPEVTQSLNQGQTYLWDDPPSTNVIANGLNCNSHIYSNSGHPIQVNLLTGDVCAFYETRSFPLLPTNLWANSYYNPVGTLTSSGGPGSDPAPTYVHLFNPNASAISVAYQFATGGATTASVPANSGTYVTMNNLTGAHFYSVVAGSTDNVADTFGSQSYSRQDGSVNWATNWDETGDDDDPTSGSINIRSSTSVLRFRFNVSANLGDTIERQAADMTGAASATLSFDYDNDGDTDSTDVFRVLASSNGGASWTQLDTIAADTSGTYSRDISAYIASNTRIRFEIYQQSTSSTSEDLYVDNVDITFSIPGGGTPPNFYAVATVDSENSEQSDPGRNDRYDWGITLVPEKLMSRFLIVGWAPGDDPTYQGTAPENTAPIWLTGGHPTSSATPNASFDICIDDGGNGGSLTDPVIGWTYDRKITGIAPRSQLKIYNGGSAVAGQDQTAMKIWVCGPTVEAPGTLLNSDALITAAWGEDPLTAAPGKPGLDMGDTVRNLWPFDPTAVAMLSFTARWHDGGVLVEWETSSEINNAGFNLYRAEKAGGEKMQINDVLIESAVNPGSSDGASYQYTDTTPRVGAGSVHFYWIESISISGQMRLQGPIEVQIGGIVGQKALAK